MSAGNQHDIRTHCLSVRCVFDSLFDLCFFFFGMDINGKGESIRIYTHTHINNKLLGFESLAIKVNIDEIFSATHRNVITFAFNDCVHCTHICTYLETASPSESFCLCLAWFGFDLVWGARVCESVNVSVSQRIESVGGCQLN